MNAKMIWSTVTNWPLVQMNVARTRAGVKLDTLEMDLVVITSMQVRCTEKQLEIHCYGPLCPKNSWVKFDKKLSIKQRSESLAFVTQDYLTVNWLSFQIVKKKTPLSPLTVSESKFGRLAFHCFPVCAMCILYVTAEFKFIKLFHMY